ncbi:hypothetical protein PHLGIDRAFT_80288, partial [Phlebiopsis gigantea 11061_1 CR5-6]
LVVYEHIITIDQEAALIWRRKWTGPTVLFAINRYNLLLQAVLQLTPVSAGVLLSVAPNVLYNKVLALSALRVCAIWGHNMWLCMIVLLLGLVPFGASIMILYRWGNGCLTSTLKVEFAARISIIAADTLVVVLTWARTYRDFREAMKLNIRVNVTALLLRDGMTAPCQCAVLYCNL